ncbi:MAG: hypothetical protein ACLQPD_25875 [Desulfomonilaceae bacterium]
MQKSNTDRSGLEGLPSVNRQSSQQTRTWVDRFHKIVAKVVEQIEVVVIVLVIGLWIAWGSEERQVSRVRNGYLFPFGNEVTVGEVLRWASNGSGEWSSHSLDSKDPLSRKYYLVEFRWRNRENKSVVAQFLINKRCNELQLEGVSVDGEFVNALGFMTRIAKLYRERAKE